MKKLINQRRLVLMTMTRVGNLYSNVIQLGTTQITHRSHLAFKLNAIQFINTHPFSNLGI